MNDDDLPEGRKTPDLLPEELLAEDLTVSLLRRDVRKATEALAALGAEAYPQVRFLVFLYYQHQEHRMRARSQEGKLAERGAPHLLISWTAERDERTEKSIRSVLDHYSRVEPSGMGAWARSQVGIGPVIAAGLLANIPIEKTPTVSALWRFAGLDPTSKWKKGDKRPFNAQLKVLAWKIGGSFAMFHKKDGCFYGKLYEQRKAYEAERNERGEYSDEARRIVERSGYAKGTGAYETLLTGKLPPVHLEKRARRYAAKMFLSHWWAEFRRRRGLSHEDPWIIAHGGHSHLIEAPKIAAAGDSR